MCILVNQIKKKQFKIPLKIKKTFFVTLLSLICVIITLLIQNEAGIDSACGIAPVCRFYMPEFSYQTADKHKINKGRMQHYYQRQSHHKLFLFCFMSDDLHRDIHRECPADRSNRKQCLFGYSFTFSFGRAFVRHGNDRRKQRYGGIKEDEDNIGTHLLISPAIRLGIGYYISSERII